MTYFAITKNVRKSEMFIFEILASNLEHKERNNDEE